MQKPSRLDLADTMAGPEPGTLLATLSELPAHGGKAVSFRQGDFVTEIFVQRVGETARVFENRCPHAGTPLNLFGERFMDMEGRHIICRTHGAKFDALTGKCLSGPCKNQFLREVAVTINEGAIYTLS